MKTYLLEDLLITHKLCTKCDCYKLKENFRLKSSELGTIQSWCKECSSSHYKKYSIEKNKDPEYIERRRKLSRGVKYSPEDQKIRSDSYKERNPDKVKARQQLNSKIRSGKIKREPCSICGSELSQAHHEDYTKPYDVVWYCQKHHMELHRKYK